MNQRICLQSTTNANEKALDEIKRKDSRVKRFDSNEISSTFRAWKLYT